MLIAGNWKMNGNKTEAIELIKGIVNSEKYSSKMKLAIFPPSIYIPFINNLSERRKFILGAQDCSEFSNGAYTGYISAEMIKDLNCEMVIVGHSERRLLANETSLMVNRKCLNALLNGLMPIICVGETIKDREDNNYLNTIEDQLNKSIPKECINSKNFKNKITIAYEPVWAIGTGKVASIENINEVHNFIKSHLNKLSSLLMETSIIYGGSVKPNNASEILNIKNVSGVLVGGASLNYDDFLDIALCSIQK